MVGLAGMVNCLELMISESFSNLNDSVIISLSLRQNILHIYYIYYDSVIPQDQN